MHETLWGPQTALALRHFAIGSQTMPLDLMHAIVRIKAAAAAANVRLGRLEADVGAAIASAAGALLAGEHEGQFPLSPWQSGSGTQSHMNVNEVLAQLASRRLGGRPVHPNDEVNRGQSSNDVVPSALHVALHLSLRDRLMPALHALEGALKVQAERHRHRLHAGAGSPRRGGRARAAGGLPRRAEDAGRGAGQDRRRRAAAGLRPARRRRRTAPAGQRAGQLDHAGQVNPTQCEALLMVCLQVMANERIAELLGRSLMLVTALVPHIGHDRAARIAGHAHAEGLTLREAALADGIAAADFDRWADPRQMLGPA